MKFLKMILISCLLVISMGTSSVWADWAYQSDANGGINESIKVTTTEKIPGANCSENGEWSTDAPMYDCYVGVGFSSVTRTVGEMIKYFTYITALAAVLFIVINGILYSMAGINDGLKTSAKDRIIKTLIGLVILLLAGVILNAIAPWIYV